MRTAAAESPPPTTESPSTFGQRLGDGPGAGGERVDLEDAHRAVPEHGPGVGERGRERRGRLGADVEPEAVGRDRVGGHDARLRAAVAGGNAVSTTMSVGSTISTPDSSARSR